VIRSFKDRGTEDLYNGVDSKAARKACPHELVKVARRKLDVVNAAARLEDLKSPGNKLERLKDDRAGQHAIRINDQYRVCFFWADGDAEEVEVTDYH
jgi:proteic killer suppression protein